MTWKLCKKIFLQIYGVFSPLWPPRDFSSGKSWKMRKNRFFIFLREEKILKFFLGNSLGLRNILTPKIIPWDSPGTTSCSVINKIINSSKKKNGKISNFFFLFFTLLLFFYFFFCGRETLVTQQAWEVDWCNKKLTKM